MIFYLSLVLVWNYTCSSLVILFFPLSLVIVTFIWTTQTSQWIETLIGLVRLCQKLNNINIRFSLNKYFPIKGFKHSYFFFVNYVVNSDLNFVIKVLFIISCFELWHLNANINLNFLSCSQILHFYMLNTSHCHNFRQLNESLVVMTMPLPWI